jgi:DNA-directed RNA polymerase specialized sigma subunit
MEEVQIARVLRLLHSSQASSVWAEFLQLYSPLILRVVRRFETEEDQVADCFLFVCEQLCRDRFRRLRRFRINGPASFATWLHSVVRNLCLDWYRKEFGRHRVSQSIARLARVDQEVFRCTYDQGMSLEETLLWLHARFPGLAREQVNTAWNEFVIL